MRGCINKKMGVCMKAVKDRIIVLSDKKIKVTKGGIYIPDTAEQRDHSGVVVAVGPDVIQAKVGDKILYNVYSELIKINDQRHRVLKEENILIILEKGETASVAKKDSEGRVSWENLD